MEGEKSEVMELTESEFLVIDELYFPINFEMIIENTGVEKNDITILLKNLLKKEFIHQMKFNSTMNDYERCLESDFEKMEEYLYVASKKGLLAHNSK